MKRNFNLASHLGIPARRVIAARKLNCDPDKVCFAKVVDDNEKIVNYVWIAPDGNYVKIFKEISCRGCRFLRVKNDMYFMKEQHFLQFNYQEMLINEINMLDSRPMAHQRALIEGIYDQVPIVGKIQLVNGEFIYVWLAKGRNEFCYLPVFTNEAEQIQNISPESSFKALNEGKEVMSLDGETTLRVIFNLPQECKLI